MSGDRSLAIYTHHKCGSTWLQWALQKILEPYGVKFFRSHRGNAIPAANTGISVLTNASYSVVKDHLCSENIHVIRNPLSVVSSAYYSHLATHATDGWERLKEQRRILQTCSASEGMSLTVAFLQSPQFYPETPGPLFALQGWNLEDAGIRTVRMEDAVTDPKRFFGEVLRLAGMERIPVPETDQFRFEHFTGRAVGQIDSASHYRSGNSEGWRTELPRPVIDFVRNEYRSLLERFYPEALDSR